MNTYLATETLRPAGDHRVAPWWLGWLFLLPVRRLWEDPRKMLADWVRPGDRVVDLGCGMGYLTLPLADLVGAGGRIVGADVEPRVLHVLARRARRRSLQDRVETRLATGDDPRLDDLRGEVDVVVAHHVLHETTDPARVLGRLAAALRPGGRLWLAEPVGHVPAELFAWEVEVARQAGLKVVGEPRFRRQRIAVLTKPVG